MLYFLLKWATILYLIRLVGGIIYRRMSGRCDCPDRMDDKTVIITGASAGIGKGTALNMAQRGARVIMACRNEKKAQNVADQIIEETGNKNVLVRIIDTADLESVKKFAEKILQEEEKIDVLINNAGIIVNHGNKSKQGFELSYATNHLGHFLLTNLLLDRLKKSSPSRIINVSSIAHGFSGFDINDLQFEKREYEMFSAYAQSKLCNVLFTKELANQLEGSGVTANVLHPGAVDTEFIEKETGMMRKIMKLMFASGFKDPNLGAQTSIHLAVSEKLKNVTGEYFEDCKLIKSSPASYDVGMAKKLWEISEDQVKEFM